MSSASNIYPRSSQSSSDGNRSNILNRDSEVYDEIDDHDMPHETNLTPTAAYLSLVPSVSGTYGEYYRRKFQHEYYNQPNNHVETSECNDKTNVTSVQSCNSSIAPGEEGTPVTEPAVDGYLKLIRSSPGLHDDVTGRGKWENGKENGEGGLGDEGMDTDYYTKLHKSVERCMRYVGVELRQPKDSNNCVEKTAEEIDNVKGKCDEDSVVVIHAERDADEDGFIEVSEVGSKDEAVDDSETVVRYSNERPLPCRSVHSGTGVVGESAIELEGREEVTSCSDESVVVQRNQKGRTSSKIVEDYLEPSVYDEEPRDIGDITGMNVEERIGKKIVEVDGFAPSVIVEETDKHTPQYSTVHRLRYCSDNMDTSEV